MKSDYAKKRIGEKSIATNGQEMELIAYRGSRDIDVKFEDGTIVHNKAYGLFKTGTIRNPNVSLRKYYKSSTVTQNASRRIGEKSIATNGQEMELIEYRGSRDIDVKFEDGTVVYNKTYNSFKHGNIQNPNIHQQQYSKLRVTHNTIERIGEKSIATNGQEMEIVAYRGSRDIDVKFEDGTIVHNKAYGLFKTGRVLNPNFPTNKYYAKKRIGEKSIATNGQEMEIVAYQGNNDIDVKFEDGTIVHNKVYDNFKKGNIGNPGVLQRTYRTNEYQTKEHIVREWKQLHPDGKKSDCTHDTGLSLNTVKKWWNQPEPEPQPKQEEKALEWWDDDYPLPEVDWDELDRLEKEEQEQATKEAPEPEPEPEIDEDQELNLEGPKL